MMACLPFFQCKYLERKVESEGSGLVTSSDVQSKILGFSLTEKQWHWAGSEVSCCSYTSLSIHEEFFAIIRLHIKL